jgi:hypothetical protein
MASFLFQPDPINGVQFRPVKIDIHLGVIKIANDEIYHDFQINNTESVIVGTERGEVLQRIQRGFEYQFEMYGKLKDSDINPATDYQTLQAWKRIQRLIVAKDKERR